jgi:hypothetical protein
MNRILTTILAAALLAASAAHADEGSIHMKDGPERRLLAASCSGCHSLDYIQMNSPFLKRAGWEAEVRKMIAVMGAPVSEADGATLVGYLVREYGVPD